MAPCSTRAGPLRRSGRAGASHEDPGGRKPAARWRPIDDRISGQAPASSESTLKDGKSAAGASPAARATSNGLSLTRKRIPDPHANIVKRSTSTTQCSIPQSTSTLT